MAGYRPTDIAVCKLIDHFWIKLRLGNKGITLCIARYRVTVERRRMAENDRDTDTLRVAIERALAIADEHNHYLTAALLAHCLDELSGKPVPRT